MNEEKMEVMEANNEEFDEVNDIDYEVYEGGSGKVIALVVGGLAGAAALGVAAYKKLKSKKDDKPKKKVKKRLRWVEVEDEVEDNVVADVEAEEIDQEETTK